MFPNLLLKLSVHISNHLNYMILFEVQKELFVDVKRCD